MTGRTQHRSPKLGGQITVLVGARIKAGRLEVGLSQSALADAAGVSFQQIQKYERGKNRVSAERLQRIAKALHKPITFFLSYEPTIEGREFDAILDRLLNWAKVSPAAHRILRRLPMLTDEDSQLVAGLIDRLTSTREK
jgi:transcriptional regulator with XRE-family HTH domain